MNVDLRNALLKKNLSKFLVQVFFFFLRKSVRHAINSGTNILDDGNLFDKVLEPRLGL